MEIAARSCDIASMDAVQRLALELKSSPRVAGGESGPRGIEMKKRVMIYKGALQNSSKLC